MCLFSYCPISLFAFWQNSSKGLFMFSASIWFLRALITTIPLKLFYSRIMTISMLVNSMVRWSIFSPNLLNFWAAFDIDIPYFLKHFLLFNSKTLPIPGFYFNISFQIHFLHFFLFLIIKYWNNSIIASLHSLSTQIPRQCHPVLRLWKPYK